MSQQKEGLILLISLGITGSLIGGGIWWFTQKPSSNLPNTTAPTATGDRLPPPPSPGEVANLAEKTYQVPSNTVIKINGATSMVSINKVLGRLFEKNYPNSQVKTDGFGSDKGILGLMMGDINLAAVSRPLSQKEIAQGLVQVPVAEDRIALVVSKQNPFSGSLSQQQVKDIFQGKITNWSALGGQSAPIQVINRPAISGTHQSFQALVLQGENFGTTANIQTLEKDTTTLLLRALGKNGIGYATFSQVRDQQTVRILPIQDMTPDNANYPYRRQLFYVYRNPTSEPVEAFLGLAISPQGQAAIALTE
ncbi:MAG: phosphate ABC transporter substrate-binding protein [Microcystaceae cyanobacterium]